MNLDTPSSSEPIIRKRKQAFGLSYGIVAGLAFSLALWGVDSLRLSQAFAYYPWTKFFAGLPLAVLICGVAGWLTARLERPLVGVALWIAAAGALAWLTIIVPIVFSPAIMKALNPELANLLQYTVYDNASEKAGVGFAWIAIASFIIAAIQVPMVEQAAFSTSIFGKITPHIICAFLMLVSGWVADTLNNQLLRDPLISMNETIQFFLDHQGKSVDPKAAREAHAASLRSVQDSIHPNRRLVVSRFDPLLEHVFILINFDGDWVECGTIVNTPLNCAPVRP